MIKGLKRALLASMVTLSGVCAFAIAPTLRQLPDVYIGDQENNIGTDNNLFVFPNAFKFDDYVSDADTTLSLLKWSFDEGDELTTPTPVIVGTRWFKINGKQSLHLGSANIAATDGATSDAPHLNPLVANELRATSNTASFHNFLFSPSSVYQASPTTPTYTLTGTPYPAPSVQTSPTTASHAAAGKVVTFYVSDGSALDKKNIIVKTIDNSTDLITGGSSFTIKQDDNFTTDIRSTVSGTGWTFTFTNNAVGPPTGGYDAVNGALTITTSQSSASPVQFRVGGWQSEKSDWLSWASVTSNNYVRVKYYVFVTGVSNPGQTNQIPDLRVRASARFAQGAILEILQNQSVADPGSATLNADIRPSLSSTQPSLYRVDMAPVFVPAFLGFGEGVAREIENYSLDPEDNGTVEMTESVIGTYPKSLLPFSQTPVQTFAPSASDAGTMKLNAASDETKLRLALSATVGEYATDTADATGVTVTEGSTGITMDTTAANKRGGPVNIVFAQATREMFAGSDLTQRPRVEYSKLYTVRYHITSTQASNKMPQVRPRVHSLGFGYTQKFEVGGAYNTGGGNQSAGNNLIALQTLPGVGTQNPDKIAAENGGYYTVILNTPLATDLNPQNSAQALLNAQPGPGVNASSRRDIKVGLDLIDSLSGADMGAVTPVEHGNLLWDRAEIRSFGQLSD